eukprot:c20343_g1_i1 orf=573-1658(+)
MEGLNRTLLDIPRRLLDGDFAEDSHREIPSECYETVCWGCGLRLVLPSAVPVFKCGWCGAISSCDMQAKKQGRCLNCSHVLDRVLVTTIITLIILIIGGGVWAVFPVLCPDLDFTFFFHAALTGILSFNTLFNYCVAAFVQAGPIPHTAWGNVDCVSKGGLEGHRFCSVCHKPKPPRAHHCRACKSCVSEMDHHCPFIGNCVGAANHRPFILFLLFAVLSNLYVFAMSVSAIIRIWKTTVDFPEVLGVASSSQVVVMLATYLQVLLGSSVSSSVRALGLLYLVAVSVSVTIGVGLLLHQQVRQLYDGYTFIETLQHENGLARGTPPGRGWRNLQRVFGHGHPVFWVFPKLVSGLNGKVHEK